MLALTYRQVACLYERYWDRKSWDIELQAKMNPFGGGGDSEDNDDLRESESGKPTVTEINLDDEGALAYLENRLDIKVKQRTAPAS